MVMARQGSGAIHIIAGRLRGARLRTVPGVMVRPTLGRVREALFNILGLQIPDSSFLDLYAGTGSIGLEAWSRGARQVVFVEQFPRALAVLRANIEHVGADPHLEVLPEGVGRAVTMLCRRGWKFDLIFLDPPYEQQPIAAEQLLDLLEPEGLLMLQLAARGEDPWQGIPGLQRVDERRYGRTRIVFYSKG
jgi:16S rRNA (guanine966-N2)-methyltransferase